MTDASSGAAVKPAPRLMTNPDLKPKHVYETVFAPEQREPMASPGQYRMLRGTVTVQSYVILALLFAVGFTGLAFADRYIHHLVILNKDGLPEKVKSLVPLDDPNLTRTAIVNMAMNVATEVMTFGFNNADERLLRARRLFTDEAWTRFAKAFLADGRLDKIKAQQQILTTIATDGAVIIQEGKWNNDYRWIVQVPVITTFQAGKRVAPQKAILQLTLVKAPTTKNPEGVAINAWSMI
jgi:intracellular multiplication protein IcmL